MKHTYTIESFHLGEWRKVMSESKDFCLGYLARAQYDHPRPELRIVRSDGRIIPMLKESTDVCVGMIAGWPTPEQYEAAAKRALEQAAIIRARQAKEDARRQQLIAAHQNNT